jgi:hypothetical protein
VVGNADPKKPRTQNHSVTMAAVRAVRAATQAHLPASDLCLNFEACDAIREATDAEVVAALNEIAARLNLAPGQNAPRQPTLALRLLKNCVDNCGPRFVELARNVRSSPLVARLDELHSRGEGEGVPKEILLKLDIQIAGAHARASSGNATSGNNMGASFSTQQDSPGSMVLTKLVSQMDVVEERLKSDRGTSTDEIQDRNDFFEQCLPRLEKLIEIGASGGLPDAILDRCLILNDAALEALKPVESLVDLLSTNIPSSDTSTAGTSSTEAMLMPVPITPAPVTPPSTPTPTQTSPVQSEMITPTTTASPSFDTNASVKLPPSSHTIKAVGSSGLSTPNPRLTSPGDTAYGIQPSTITTRIDPQVQGGFIQVSPPSTATDAGQGAGASAVKAPTTTHPNELFNDFDPFSASKKE